MNHRWSIFPDGRSGGWQLSPFSSANALTINPARLLSHLRLMVYDWAAICQVRAVARSRRRFVKWGIARNKLAGDSLNIFPAQLIVYLSGEVGAYRNGVVDGSRR